MVQNNVQNQQQVQNNQNKNIGSDFVHINKEDYMNGDPNKSRVLQRQSDSFNQQDKMQLNSLSNIIEIGKKLDQMVHPPSVDSIMNKLNLLE